MIKLLCFAGIPVKSHSLPLPPPPFFASAILSSTLHGTPGQRRRAGGVARTAAVHP